MGTLSVQSRRGTKESSSCEASAALFAGPVGWMGQPRVLLGQDNCPRAVLSEWLLCGPDTAAQQLLSPFTSLLCFSFSLSELVPHSSCPPLPSGGSPLAHSGSSFWAKAECSGGSPGEDVQAGPCASSCSDPQARPGCHLLHAQLLLQSGGGRLLSGSGAGCGHNTCISALCKAVGMSITGTACVKVI